MSKKHIPKISKKFTRTIVIELTPSNASKESHYAPAFVTVSELFLCEVSETFVILSAILLSIKSPVASAVFGIALF